ncbi:MAG TPA: DegQ family serine endoprotease [Myxococcota bacterium]|nr:DegQ family serine endoprotease [Myxococcota bacterium]
MQSGIRKRVLFAGVAAAAFGLGAATATRTPPGLLIHPVAEAAVVPASSPESTDPTGTSGGTLPSFVSLVEAVSPAVVHVKVVSVVKTSGPEGGFPFPFGEDSPFHGFRLPPMQPPSGRQLGSGSGFIIRKDGVVLTNNHVVEQAKEITVALSDSHEFPAKILGRDPKTDLAVLKIDAKTDLPVAQLGDSDALKVGEWVVAIGNPFGLDNTVTAGIVSAKGRAIGNGPYDQFIQTDAPINPGNSGGPLFNQRGEVVGINTAIFSQSGGNIGIGFAVPINVAKELVPQLETEGHVTRGWLGVSIQKLTPELAESLGVSETQGALVAGVTPGSPAAKAGLKTGDVITTYDGKKVEEHGGLPSLVAATPVGATVPVQVLRDRDVKTLSVTVAKLADEEFREAAPAKGKWGLALRELTPEEREERGLEDGQGVLVASVDPGSPAEEAGLHAGDVVLQANRKPVGSVEALRQEIGKVEEGKRLPLLVRPADGGDRFAALGVR